MKCKKCGHEWMNKGRGDWICCPNCHSKFRRPPEEGIEAMNILYFLSYLKDTQEAETFLTLWLQSINNRRSQSRRRELDESIIRSFLAEYGDDRFVSDQDQKHRALMRMKGRVLSHAKHLGISPNEFLTALSETVGDGDP